MFFVWAALRPPPGRRIDEHLSAAENPIIMIEIVVYRINDQQVMTRKEVEDS